MAINFLPTGLEGIAPAIQQLGLAFGQKLGEPQRREKAFQDLLVQNPGLVHTFGKMVSEADTPEKMTGLSKMFNIDPKVLGMIGENYNPTIQEELESDPQYRQDVMAASRAEPGTTIAEQGARVATANSIRDNITIANEEGLPRLRINTEKIQLQGTQEDIARQRKTLTDYEAWVNTLSPHMKGIALAGLANPNLASHLLAHEQMGFEEQMARMRATAEQKSPMETMVEMFKLRSSMQEEIGEAMAAFDKSLEDGDDQKSRVQMGRLNDLMKWQQTFFPNETTLNVTERAGLFSSKFGYNPLAPVTEQQAKASLINTFAEGLASGRGTSTDLTTSKAWQDLTPAERQQVFTQARAAGWGGNPNPNLNRREAVGRSLSNPTAAGF